MHMAMVIGGGLVLLGLFCLFGRLWGGSMPDLALAANQPMLLKAMALAVMPDIWIHIASSPLHCSKILSLMYTVRQGTQKQ